MTLSRRHFLQTALGAATLSLLPKNAAAAPAGINALGSRPNIIFLLADDVGFGDMGWLFQNRRPEGEPRINTPHFDRAAAEGLTLHDHYSPCPVCAPSRASLMSGLTQGHCTLRNNQFDRPLADDLTLARVLKAAGYSTYAIGKWGIGGGGESGHPLEAHPLDRGFDHFYGFLFHLAGHTYYHFDDYLGKEKKLYMGTHEDRTPATTEGIYSTDLFTARAKKYITDHRRATPEKPFFLYFAINAIHGSGRLGASVPHKAQMHVPGRPYPEGQGLNGGLQWPLEPEPIEARNTWIHPDYRNLQNNKARYATGIRRMDDAFGDLLQLLKDLKIDDNTLVVFTSDNGPAAEQGADPRHFQSAGPFDGFKRDCYEGGLREPTLVRWPGTVPPGTTSTAPSGFWDWMPTFAMFAGLPPPAHSDGVSLSPTLIGAGKQRRSVIYSEYAVGADGQPGIKELKERKGPIRGQQQMLRIGEYVAIRTQIKSHETPIRLYNILKDPHQDNDLASDPAYAKQVAHMTKELLRHRRPDQDAKRPYDDAPVPAIEIPEAEIKNTIITYRKPATQYPWVPDFSQALIRPSGNTPGRPGHSLNAAPLRLSAATDYAIGGFIRVAKTGTYTFHLTGEGGAHFRLHGAFLFGAERGEAKGGQTAEILLEAGLHPATLYAAGGPITLTCPGLAFEITIA